MQPVNRPVIPAQLEHSATRLVALMFQSVFRVLPVNLHSTM